MSRAGIPTVKFDASRVTETVKTDVRKTIRLLEEIDSAHCEQVYDAALCSISAGGDLSVLFNALMQMNVNSMTKGTAAEIAHFLNRRATALMDKERQESIGIKQALWMYSGAPCEIDPRKTTGQDAAHRAADMKPFNVSKGMLLDGKWTWPGFERGCKCVSKSVVVGFS
jgi:hypothetical protein